METTQKPRIFHPVYDNGNTWLHIGWWSTWMKEHGKIEAWGLSFRTPRFCVRLAFYYEISNSIGEKIKIPCLALKII